MTFARNTCTITATTDAHGSITPAGATKVIEGDDGPAYAIAAASGYHVINVTVDGLSVGIKTTYTFHNVTEDHIIAVTTAADATAFTITPTAGAHGVITPAAPFMVAGGASVTFFFVPETGYTVDAVTVDGHVQPPLDVTRDDLSYTFENVTANHTISVSFAVSVQKSSVSFSLSGLKSGVCKYGKSVIAKGTLKPVRAATVKITVQRKVSGTWKTVTTKSRTTSAASGAYRWTYKPTKKGSYRIRTSVAKSTYYTSASSPWRTCKVK